jgi:hypothetical protein
MTIAPASSMSSPDPELEALPEPRRPGRSLTLLTLIVTGFTALLVAWGLRHDVSYALGTPRPLELGSLEKFQPRPELANRFVRAEGALSATVAVRYRRPLESGSYRFAQLADNPSIWVQINVPEDLEGPHFVAPTSFVGRLLPLSDGGLRLHGLEHAMRIASRDTGIDGAWVLLDDEAPASVRYLVAVALLLSAFALFNVWALVRLLRPVRDG